MPAHRVRSQCGDDERILAACAHYLRKVLIVYLRHNMINWDDIRKQFPVTENYTYLNAAAAGPLARQTMEAATEYYGQMMDDADTHWDEWLARREQVRRKVAAFVNAEPDEIALTTNTSSGINVIVDALETH